MRSISSRLAMAFTVLSTIISSSSLHAHVDTLVQILGPDPLTKRMPAHALPAVGKVSIQNDANALDGKSALVEGEGSGFKLDLGQLPVGMYAIYLSGRVDQPGAVFKTTSKSGAAAASTTQLKPLLLRLMINSGNQGQVEQHIVRAGYSVDNQYEYVVIIFFHAPEARTYQGELTLAPGSLVTQLHVDRVDLRNPLAQVQFAPIKNQRVLHSEQDVVNLRQAARAAGKTYRPLRPAELTESERASLDQVIWNRAMVPINAHPAGDTYPISRTTHDAEVKKYLEEQGAKLGKPLGEWKLAGKTYEQPWVLANKELGLQYTLEDYNANKSLPAPWPIPEGKALAFMDATATGLPISFNWGLVPSAINNQYHIMLKALIGPSSDGTGNLADRYMIWDDQQAAADGAFILAAYAYRYPAYDYRAHNIEGLFHASRIFDPSNVNGRGCGYQGWSTKDIVAVIEAYDKLYPYIRDNPALAQRLGKFIPWIKTPQDVIKLIDSFLVQRAAQDAVDMMLYSYVLPTAAAALGPGQVAEKYLSLFMDQGVYLRDFRSGFNDFITNSYSRNGMNYIGSTYYVVGESAGELLEVANVLQKYVAAGGNKRFDVADPVKFPRLAAMGPGFLGLAIAGGHRVGVGDVSDPAAAYRPYVNLQPDVVRNTWLWNGDPAFAWILVNKAGQGSLSAQQWQKAQTAAAQARDPELHSTSGLLEGFGIARLEEGSESTDIRHKNAVMLRFGVGTGHAHPDSLDLEIYAHGLRMSSDMGGRMMGTYGKPSCMSTYVHNVVQVDDRDFTGGPQNATGYSWLQALVTTPYAQYVAGSARAENQPQVKLYQRGVLQVISDPGDGKTSFPRSYLFDVFRVAGGSVHTWCFHGCVSQAVATNANLQPAQSETAVRYLARHQEGTRMQGVAPQRLEADWTLRRTAEEIAGVKLRNFEQLMLGKLFDPDSPLKHTRAHLLGQEGAPVLAGNWYANAMPSRQHSFPLLYVRQENRTQEGSVFPAIYETYAGQPFITSVRLLPLGDGKLQAQSPLALEVKNTLGHTDLLFADPQRGRTHNLDSTQLSGNVALISRDKDGLRLLTLVGGQTLKQGEVTVTVERSEYTGAIRSVDYLNRTAQLDQALPSGILDGATFTVGNDKHQTTRQVQSVQGDRIVFAKDLCEYVGGVAGIDGKLGQARLDVEPVLQDYHPWFYQGMTAVNEAGKVLGLAQVHLGDRFWYTGWPEVRRHQALIKPGDLSDANGDGRVTAALHVAPGENAQKFAPDGATLVKLAEGEKMLDLEITGVRADGLMVFTRQHPREYLDAVKQAHPGWPYHRQILRNEKGDKQWIVNMPGDFYNLGLLDGALKEGDFPDANGDGRALVRLYDLGPGDRVTLASHLTLRRIAAQTYELRSNVPCTITLPGSVAEIQPMNSTPADLPRTVAGKNNQTEIRLQASDIARGPWRISIK